MIKILKIFLIFILLYFLILIEGAFLVHFKFLAALSNIFIFIFCFLYNLFEKKEKLLGVYVFGIAGLLMDVFSSHFLGLNAIILILLSLFVKLVLKEYIKVPYVEKL